MLSSRIAIGNLKEARQADTLKAALAEFVSVIFFIFPIEGLAYSFSTGTVPTIGSIHVLTPVVLVHTFALCVATLVGKNKSAGHVNPAITFGLLAGGHITLVRSIMFWIAQLLGAYVSLFLLKIGYGGGVLAVQVPTSWQKSLFWGIVMSIGIIYVFYSLFIDPKRGNLEVMGPLAISLIVGANLYCQVFVGTPMNPLVPFGIAANSGVWHKYHWVYWVGTFTGAGIGGVIYQVIYIDDDAEYQELPMFNNKKQLLPTSDDF